MYVTARLHTLFLNLTRTLTPEVLFGGSVQDTIYCSIPLALLGEEGDKKPANCNPYEILQCHWAHSCEHAATTISYHTRGTCRRWLTTISRCVKELTSQSATYIFLTQQASLSDNPLCLEIWRKFSKSLAVRQRIQMTAVLNHIIRNPGEAEGSKSPCL